MQMEPSRTNASACWILTALLETANSQRRLRSATASPPALWEPPTLAPMWMAAPAPPTVSVSLTIAALTAPATLLVSFFTLGSTLTAASAVGTVTVSPTTAPTPASLLATLLTLLHTKIPASVLPTMSASQLSATTTSAPLPAP